MGRFAVLSTHADPRPVRVLATDVRGQSCVRSFLGLEPPSYADAARQALSQVPGANVLVDVDVYFVEPLLEPVFTTNCVRVSGKAGVFE